MSLSTPNEILRLYYSDGSPYARICRMAIRECGLTSKVQELTTTLRDPNAAVLSYSPVGRVPALVLTEGTTITETSLILKWFEVLGSKAIIPADARGLADYGCALGMLYGIVVWNRELRRPASEQSSAALSLEEGRVNRVADAIENDVSNGRYEIVDAAFFALAAALGYAERRHTAWKWREGRPSLEQWFIQASQRASFSETLPPPSGI